MDSNREKIKIDLDYMISELEKSLSIKFNKKPIVLLNEYGKGKAAASGSFNGDDYLILNSLYFSDVNGDIYINSSNADLLKIIITHELVHLFSNNNEKSGITGDKKYEFQGSYGNENKKINLDFNEALNEGITQMIAERECNNSVGPFFNIYYEYKKISEILDFLFGSNVIYRSYFKQSGELKRGMNNYCNNLFDKINEKLTYSYYLTSFMKDKKIDQDNISFPKLEKGICKDLKNELFMESLDLIINNLVVPWIKNVNSSDIATEINSFLELFNDNVELKNKVYYLIMKGCKENKTIPTYLQTDTDKVVSHLIAYNNGGNYKILDDGNIIDLSTNSVIPYDERLYEYFYSKIISKDYYKYIEGLCNNASFSNNKINISIGNFSIMKRRMIMLAIKEYMKSKNIIILNDLDSLDSGFRFSISYVNEKLEMSDVIYLCNNFSNYYFQGDNSNIIKIVSKDTNREVKSNSIMSLCKISYKIMLNNLASYNYQNKWDEFYNTAYDQISSTGTIKKSFKYNNNPFLTLFNDGFGCEWFYKYMQRFSFPFDKINSNLFYSENEMNLSLAKSSLENEKLSLLISDFILKNKTDNIGNIRK